MAVKVRPKSQLTNNILVTAAFLENATIEHSLKYLCMCVCICVCVCFCMITRTEIDLGTRNLNTL